MGGGFIELECFFDGTTKEEGFEGFECGAETGDFVG